MKSAWSWWRAFALAGFCAAGAASGYWVMDYDPPVRVMSRKLETPIVRPGADLKIRYVVDRYRNCALHVDRVMLDGEQVRHTLPDENFAAGSGMVGRQEYSIVIPIPEKAAPGPAVLMVFGTSRCNPLHWLVPIKSEMVPLWFDIAP